MFLTEAPRKQYDMSSTLALSVESLVMASVAAQLPLQHLLLTCQLEQQ